MSAPRFLIVIADDYGIGPETSRAILELANRGTVTGSVLLVNSPHADDAVRAWRLTSQTLELGWHPCLTLDSPLAPASTVSTLIGPDGCFWPLGKFLSRLVCGLIRPVEIEREFAAQLDRFQELVGGLPTLVNSHQHISLFPPVGAILRNVLTRRGIRPYFRRVREPGSMLMRIPGARIKRLCLSLLGNWEARQQARQGFPGQDWLAGITDPSWIRDPQFLVRWVRQIPGRTVELACHPGHFDSTLFGRDANPLDKPDDGLVQRRVDEFRLLSDPSFREACQQAGFQLLSPTNWLRQRIRGANHAA